eukprot:11017579-Heterocapsa_arctica.AAC.1
MSDEGRSNLIGNAATHAGDVLQNRLGLEMHIADIHRLLLDREAEELDNEVITGDDKTNHAERQRAVLAKQRRWALKKRRMLLDGV